jgi:hypothetical protein
MLSVIMLNVAYMPFKLSVVMVSVVMLDVVMLEVVMLDVVMMSVIMLSVVMLDAIILSAVMLSVVMLSAVPPLQEEPSLGTVLYKSSHKNIHNNECLLQDRAQAGLSGETEVATELKHAFDLYTKVGEKSGLYGCQVS